MNILASFYSFIHSFIHLLIHSASIFWVLSLCQTQVQHLRYKDGYHGVPAIGVHQSSPSKRWWEVGQGRWRGMGRFKKHLGGRISRTWWWIDIGVQGRGRYLEWLLGFWLSGLNTWEIYVVIAGLENVKGKAGVVGGRWERAGGQGTMSRMNFWGRQGSSV